MHKTRPSATKSPARSSRSWPTSSSSTWKRRSRSGSWSRTLKSSTALPAPSKKLWSPLTRKWTTVWTSRAKRKKKSRTLMTIYRNSTAASKKISSVGGVQRIFYVSASSSCLSYSSSGESRQSFEILFFCLYFYCFDTSVWGLYFWHLRLD